MQFKKIAFLTIFSLLLFTGCGDSKVEETAVEEPIKKERDYTLTNIDGNKINILAKDEKLFFYNYEGKIILLNFFATWCSPCRAEIPTLNNLKEKYSNDFEIIAVSMAQRDGTLTTNEALNEFISHYKINFPVVNSDVNFALAKEVGDIQNVPTMVLFDKDGKIIQTYEGVVPQEMLETDIKKALGK